jgi:hypothetical protein
LILEMLAGNKLLPNTGNVSFDIHKTVYCTEIVILTVAVAVTLTVTVAVRVTFTVAVTVTVTLSGSGSGSDSNSTNGSTSVSNINSGSGSLKCMKQGGYSTGKCWAIDNSWIFVES